MSTVSSSSELSQLSNCRAARLSQIQQLAHQTVCSQSLTGDKLRLKSGVITGLHFIAIAVSERVDKAELRSPNSGEI